LPAVRLMKLGREGAKKLPAPTMKRLRRALTIAAEARGRAAAAAQELATVVRLRSGIVSAGLCLRVRGEIMGPGKYENVGKSQPDLVRSDPIIYLPPHPYLPCAGAAAVRVGDGGAAVGAGAGSVGEAMYGGGRARQREGEPKTAA
jgi:hypothetical protein